MVEYALLISQSALASFNNLAGQVNAIAGSLNSMTGSVNWLLVGGVVFGLLFIRAALKPPRT